MQVLIFILCQFLGHPGTSISQESFEPVIADTVKYQIYDKFEDLEKDVFTSKGDEVLVVNFWATWCAPCVKEMPYFESLHKENENVRVVLVSLDFTDQINKRLVPFVKKKGLTPELFVLADMDANKWIDMVDANWSGTIPATLAIKGDQRKFTEKEFHSTEEIKEFIKQLEKN